MNIVNSIGKFWSNTILSLLLSLLDNIINTSINHVVRAKMITLHIIVLRFVTVRIIVHYTQYCTCVMHPCGGWELNHPDWSYPMVSFVPLGVQSQNIYLLPVPLSNSHTGKLSRYNLSAIQMWVKWYFICPFILTNWWQNVSYYVHFWEVIAFSPLPTYVHRCLVYVVC